MDWLTQGSGAKQQALLSSKTETPNKTASAQELQCCKEPFSSQVEPYNLPYWMLAAGSRGYHCVSGVEEWGRDSCGVKTTTWKKIPCSETMELLSKHIDKMALWNRHMYSINSNNISTTQHKFFRMPNFMTHASHCPWLNAFIVLVPPCPLGRKESRQDPTEKSGPGSKFSWMWHSPPYHSANSCWVPSVQYLT